MCPFSQTVKHPLCVKHPPSVKYARCFLSELIRKVSSGHCLSSSHIVSGTWLALQKGPSALLCLLQLRSVLCPLPALQTPFWQLLPGQQSASWVPPMEGVGKEKPGYCFLSASRHLWQPLHLLCGPCASSHSYGAALSTLSLPLSPSALPPERCWRFPAAASLCIAVLPPLEVLGLAMPV